MYDSIRSKIIFAFILLIVLPVTVVILLSYSIQKEYIPFPFIDDISNFSMNQAKLIYGFESSFNAETFDNKSLDLIVENNKDFFKRVLVTDDKKIIYDSDIAMINQNLDNISSEYKTFFEHELLLVSNDLDLNIYLVPVAKYESIKMKILFIPLLFLFVALLIIIISIILLSKYLSNKMLIPLAELNLAVDRISHGDLDFEINIDGNSEIREFSQKFSLMKDKLNQSLKQQQKYEQSRKKLLTSITHDLRTPLTSIKGYIEALEDGIVRDQETYENYLKVVSEKSDKLDRLIDDLFIFTKLDIGEFTYHKEPVNSNAFLTTFLDDKALEYEDKKIDFVVKKPLISTIINIDIKRISQVLDNIISNAHKFTKSYIKVSTSINRKFLTIDIEDNGIGITKSKQEKIFDLFYKIDSSRTNTGVEGSGIGLNICKQIINAHNGEISIESEVDKKTIFTIYIPLYLDLKK